MADFSYHPPDPPSSTQYSASGAMFSSTRPSSSGGPYTPTSYDQLDNGPASGAGTPGASAFRRTSTSGGFDPSGRRSVGATDDGLDDYRGGKASPQPAPVLPPPPPPFGSGSTHFFGAQQQAHHPGINVRNTRPMTAPSSVSAPYFHGAVYSPHTAGPTSFYPGAAMFSGGPLQQHPHAPQPSSSHGLSHQPTFQYQVDSGALSHDPNEQLRGRGFSLPELVGVHQGGQGGLDGHSLNDDRRYSSGSEERDSPNSSGLFSYVAPPRSYYQPSPDQAAADQYYHSRPTTAESRPGSSHATLSHPGHPPPMRTTPFGGRLPGKSDYALDGGQQVGESKVYNFVAAAGQTSKRPRRRYDEIERLYTCDYPGCTKAYGTLNHLNSHKTMQKHGPKSTPAQFKELRKAWRENKKAQAAAVAKAVANGTEPPPPTSALPLPQRAAAAPLVLPPAPERPRPATSGGEYHYSISAPYTTNTPLYGGGHSLHLPPPPGFVETVPPTHYAPAPPGSYSLPPVVTNGLPPSAAANGFDPTSYSPHSSSPHRPVTAPNYHAQQLPAFGSGFPGATTATSRYPFAMNGGGGRRLSLPGEIKQPTPVFGYNANPAGEAGFGSIQEEVSQRDDGNGSE